MKGVDLADLERGYRSRTHVFQDLMRRRVRRLMIVSSVYDSFILEEDGGLDEGLVSEYVGLNLVHLPRLYRAATGATALSMAKKDRGFDLIITTHRLGDMDAHQFVGKIRAAGLDVPVVLLSYDWRDLEHLTKSRGLDAFERVVLWEGDHRILLAIVKLIEDAWNVEADTARIGVQSIIVIEDNVRYYSALLPILYAELMRHSQNVISDSFNLADRIMRMRARPKILLCHSYEEAWQYFERYHESVLGVISDVRFPREGVDDARAGIEFAQRVRLIHPDVPILLHSSEPENQAVADAIGVSFVLKGSPLLLNHVRSFMVDYLSFGDFVFRTPDGEEVARARDLPELEECLRVIPEESLLYHAGGNHFSNWLKARTEFYLARELRPHRVEDYDSPSALREFLIQSLRNSRRDRRRGAVEDFRPKTLEAREFFVRIGSGSLGGKGRGLAFVNKLVETAGLRHQLDGVSIAVPPAAVIATDLFDEFLDANDLRDFAIHSDDDEEIERRFLAAQLPPDTKNALREVAVRMGWPLSFRSSSLLEDSQHQPFAGIYRTIMFANVGPLEVRFRQMQQAVKSVYASTFMQRAKAYMAATSYRVEEEKMAVVIMQLVGSRHGDRFYPDFSGVVRSHNFYPVAPLEGRDGIAAVALGLGTFVVEGGAALRFCPRYPRHILQFSSVEDTLAHSQREFHALELVERGEDASPVRRFDLKVAESDGVLWAVGSTYSADNDAVYDGISRRGTRLVSFAPILRQGVFPLSEILQLLLKVGRWGMSSEVEIEFAVNLSVPEKERKQFRILQMRPMVPEQELEEVTLDDFAPESLACDSRQVLGNGVLRGLRDIVLVDIDRFNRSRTREVAREIRAFNFELTREGKPYLLVGVGRWGSSDPWLGIPVTWDQISGARVIVESSFRDLRVTPSQGSHFFQNLTTMRVGYFTVDPEDDGGRIDWPWLQGLPAHSERSLSRRIRLEEPITVVMDGRTQRGVILKPGVEIRGTDPES